MRKDIEYCELLRLFSEYPFQLQVRIHVGVQMTSSTCSGCRAAGLRVGSQPEKIWGSQLYYRIPKDKVCPGRESGKLS